jgi:hypothetical protein
MATTHAFPHGPRIPHKRALLGNKWLQVARTLLSWYPIFCLHNNWLETIPVLVDVGFRPGSDVMNALALGSSAQCTTGAPHSAARDANDMLRKSIRSAKIAPEKICLP